MTDNIESTLDQLAIQIPADLEHQKLGLEKQKLGRSEWIEASFNLCVHLAEARQLHTADTTFSKWCADNGFGLDIIPEDTRWRAVVMGQQPNELRACLNETTRTSLQHIYREEFSRFGQVTEPTKPQEGNTRQEKAANMRRRVEEFVADCGEKGTISADIEATLGAIAHQRVSDLKAEGILVVTGEKRSTGNSKGKADVLVHRDFVTEKMRKARKDQTRGRKSTKPPVPVKRDQLPIQRMKDPLPREVTGMPSDEEANEIDPETGLRKMQAYVQKWGHAQVFPLDQRILMEDRKHATQLGAKLRDLNEALRTGFLKTPQAQAPDLVPIEPSRLVALICGDEIGLRLRERIEERLIEVEAALAEVNAYVEALRAALNTISDMKTTTHPESTTTH